MITFNTQSFSA